MVELLPFPNIQVKLMLQEDLHYSSCGFSFPLKNATMVMGMGTQVK